MAAALLPPAHRPQAPEAYFAEKKMELLTPKQKEIAKAIGQLAVRILWVFSVVWMAGAVLPLAFHAVLIPAMAAGAACLAAFLFQYDGSAFKQPIVSLPPMLRQLIEKPIQFQAPAAPPLAPAAPRGLFRQGQNCSINSIVQFIESCPRLAQWFRIPPPQDLEPFIHYIGQYEPRPEVILAFRAFLPAMAQPLPIPQAFAQFLDGYAPAADYRNEFVDFRNTYADLLLLQPYFSQFLAAYDEARANNRPVVNANSQNIRILLSRISALIDPSSGVQLDAAEVLALIMGALPKGERIRIQKSTHYNIHGQPPIADHPEGITRKEEYLAVLPLEIDSNQPRPDLLNLVNHFCDEDLHIPNQNDWITQRDVFNQDRKYQPVHRHFEFVEPPPFLMIQLKRFKEVPPPKSWLTRVLPAWWPGMQWRYQKISNPIRVPDRFTLGTQNGAQIYRLASVDVHVGGSPNSGHYITYKSQVVDGQTVYYCLDDSRVTQVPREAWVRAVETSYLLHFLPEPA